MMDRISANAADFAAQLNQLGDRLERELFDKVIKKAMFDLWAECMSETPVETGRAMGSWSLDTDWNDWALPPGDYVQGILSNVGNVVNSLPKSDRYVLFNNVEYISELEDGHSTQAPSGFIANALAAFADHLQAANQEFWLSWKS